MGPFFDDVHNKPLIHEPNEEEIRSNTTTVVPDVSSVSSVTKCAALKIGNVVIESC